MTMMNVTSVEACTSFRHWRTTNDMRYASHMHWYTTFYKKITFFSAVVRLLGVTFLYKLSISL